MNVSSKLKRKAISLGLCEDWTKSWGNPSLDEMVEMYVKGLDFCIQHDYPSPLFMKENFDGVMQKHGVFSNDFINLNIVNKKPNILVLNGMTSGTVNVLGFNIVTIHVRHSSNVKIYAKDNSIVFVRVYDKAKISIHSSHKSKGVVFCNSKFDKNIEHTGNIKVIKE